MDGDDDTSTLHPNGVNEEDEEDQPGDYSSRMEDLLGDDDVNSEPNDMRMPRTRTMLASSTPAKMLRTPLPRTATACEMCWAQTTTQKKISTPTRLSAH